MPSLQDWVASSIKRGSRPADARLFGGAGGGAAEVLEPTAALDISVKRRLADQIPHLRCRGGAQRVQRLLALSGAEGAV